MKELNFPISRKIPNGQWVLERYDIMDWFIKIMVGILVTIFIASLGAPFWFHNIVDLRAGDKQPGKSSIGT